MKTILAIGECMMELIEHSPNLLNRSYAGDTYNALVYAKRFNPQLDCQFFTAVGEDAISHTMIKAWQSHQLNTDKVITTDDSTIGIYAIATDDKGERSFSYWRNDSAATQMMSLLPLDLLLKKLGNTDTVFFSGITLGILSEEDKHVLLSLTKSMREQGATIAFDPNYRVAMWKGAEHAKLWLERAYQHSDIVLPGLDEHQLLFDHQSPIDVMLYCQQLGATEIIIKSGEQGTLAYQCGELIAHETFIAAPIQVDSTAAGDSFAGTYLASRLSGYGIEDALVNACNVARVVVQHPGAIIDNKHYCAVVTSNKKVI
ncbi:sugar kinase [Shewanella olleyana]|uniref:sugar kinase n=1 Tax=Shewanella olleyana TaxID=135626 RepID=UPI00201071B4|nr:sugar kinase [Shewanella olleyana]MCL1065643.1 sugar kinase [Shewanella olleyana]